MTKEELMRKAIELSVKNVAEGGGPFGAVIARNGEIVATGVNRVTDEHDPTAHAEVSAIRAACRKLNTFDLSGCEAEIGFDDAFIYEEIALKPEDRRLASMRLLPEEAIKAFEDWRLKDDKVEY